MIMFKICAIKCGNKYTLIKDYSVLNVQISIHRENGDAKYQNYNTSFIFKLETVQSKVKLNENNFQCNL